MERGQLLHILGLSELDYCNYQHQCFTYWCSVMAEKFKRLERALILDERCYLFYTAAWEHLVEELFCIEMKPYLRAGLKDTNAYRLIFKDYHENMLGIFPADLLKAKNTRT